MITTNSNHFGSYAFRFKEKHVGNIAQIWSTGWDQQTSTSYLWDGRERKDQNKCIFQYTISGKGTLEIKDQWHTLETGQAFIVSTPGDYRYFLPKKSDQWEFIYITLYGQEAVRCWDYITRHFGSILRFHPDSAPIRTLLEIYHRAEKHNITNAYESSSLAYQFIMDLYRYSENIDHSLDNIPENLMKSMMYAQNHFDHDITPEDLAEISGLSRYHFTRLFRKATGMTPIQYLTKLRIYKATEMLINTNQPIEKIATKVGYANANYFNKVFRKYIGSSPGHFREHQETIPFDQLFMS